MQGRTFLNFYPLAIQAPVLHTNLVAGLSLHNISCCRHRTGTSALTLEVKRCSFPLKLLPRPCVPTSLFIRAPKRSLYSHFSLVRTISGKEKILYYRELLVSEKFFKTRWIALVLPSPVILGEKIFYYRELLVSEKFLLNTLFPLWFYSLCRVSGLFWAKSIISLKLFSFSSDKDRRTDSRIRRKNTAQPRRESNPGSCEF